jgi:large conductance mechanosensitive channel
MWNEFKKFAMRGNVVDMAVGIIIGASFGTIVKSLVDDIIMPPIGLVLGDIPFKDFKWMLKGGDPAVAINYGQFVNNVISFLIVAFAVFLLIRAMNRLMSRDKPAPPPAPTTKDCPYCRMSIPLAATRCGHCTSEIKAA